jgi:hypothetical protein
MSFRVRYNQRTTPMPRQDEMSDEDVYEFLPSGVLKVQHASTGKTSYFAPGLWLIVEADHRHEPGETATFGGAGDSTSGEH